MSDRLPDFLVIGAPKCGTSTLFHDLAAHSGIHGSARKEIDFFNFDDLSVHGDQLLVERADAWRAFDWDGRRAELLAAYAGAFAGARPDQLAFEASPKYLASERAPRRAAETVPDARLIAVLRHPVDRAWSHYWHEVRKGKAIHPFEERIRLESPSLLAFGLYREQIERWLAHYPRERLLVLAFEELAADREAVLARTFRFLGLDPALAPPSGGVRNPRREPRWAVGQRWLNRFDRTVLGRRRTGERFGPRFGRGGRIGRSVTRRLGRANLTRGADRAMAPATRELLTEYYARENRGLAAVVDLDLARWWGMPS